MCVSFLKLRRRHHQLRNQLLDFFSVIADFASPKRWITSGQGFGSCQLSTNVRLVGFVETGNDSNRVRRNAARRSGMAMRLNRANGTYSTK